MMIALILVVMSIGLSVAAWRDLAQGSSGDSRGATRPRKIEVTPMAAVTLGLPDRIRRAGREHRLTPRGMLTIKAMTAAVGTMAGLIALPLLSGRFGPPALVAAGLAGFFLPDLMLERAARRRHRRMIAALPDALDLLSVSVSTGRSLGASLVELSRSGRGPLAIEFGRAGEDMAWGSGQRAALDAMRRRIKGKEIASLCASLERSRKLGSPLAEQLRRQSTGLRQGQRRAIEEEAARAAPKIQLVIALVLVPSVLLLMAAALIANSETLFNAGL